MSEKFTEVLTLQDVENAETVEKVDGRGDLE